MKKILIFLIFSFFTGCAFVPFASPIITGIIIYKDGKANKYYDIDQEVIKRSVRKSFFDLNIKITKDQKSRGGYSIQGVGHDSFSVVITKVGRDTTCLSVRINTFGNKPYSELFFQKVDSNIEIINYDKEGMPVKLADPS